MRVIALALLADRAPVDLVLCDPQIADISGRDLCRDAYARWPELRSRFLFMTRDLDADAPSLDDASAVLVLGKPFDRVSLRAAVASVMRSFAASRGRPTMSPSPNPCRC